VCRCLCSWQARSQPRARPSITPGVMRSAPRTLIALLRFSDAGWRWFAARPAKGGESLEPPDQAPADDRRRNRGTHRRRRRIRERRHHAELALEHEPERAVDVESEQTLDVELGRHARSAVHVTAGHPAAPGRPDAASGRRRIQALPGNVTIRPALRSAARAARPPSGEGDHAPDPVLRLHQVKAAVDVVERDLVRNEGLEVELAVEIQLHQLGNLIAALDAAE
jgi:hypothetical protein